jgi:hypothetical protein
MGSPLGVIATIGGLVYHFLLSGLDLKQLFILNFTVLFFMNA